MTADQYINGKTASGNGESQARRRAWFAWAPLIAGICLLTQVSQVLAGSFTLMPPQGFQRQSGPPVTETVSFNALDPGAVYTLHVYNGGLEDHELTGERVSSST
ncbi:MAG: hypothetical protein GY916_01240, partial [Gammaproteobacteria bacterium]|nr:hypothetical protein [Gammaproteobacteria bacterium]